MIEVNEIVQMGELERVKNSLDPEEVKYVNEAGLVDLLQIYKLQEAHCTTDLPREEVSRDEEESLKET